MSMKIKTGVIGSITVSTCAPIGPHGTLIKVWKRNVSWFELWQLAAATVAT